MKHLLLTTIALMLLMAANAQVIKNTDFKQQGNAIVVTYNLSVPLDKTAEIDLYVSTDGGRSYKGPLKAVSGDIGKMETDGAKKITWKVFEEFGTLQGDITFEVRAQLKNKPVDNDFFMAYNISGSSFVGITIGSVGRWGWYLRGKTNLNFAQGDYTTNDQSLTDYDGNGYYLYTDQTQQSRLGMTVGAIKRLGKTVYVYAGGGYGSRVLLWNAEEFSYDDESQIGNLWAEHEEQSATGAEIELGVMFRMGKVNLSAGVNTIGFSFFEANGGIGLFF